MTCKEFQELIAGAVDRCLRAEEQSAFDRHADLCPPCRHEFEAERSTKDLLRQRARMVAVPVRLQASILDRLARENRNVILAGPLRHPYVRLILAAAATFILFVLLVDRQPERSMPFGPVATAGLAPDNVLVQSMANFHLFLRGDLEPQLTSADPGRVTDYFAGKTAFPVAVPAIHDCMLIGGGLNEHSGTPIAHLVYRTGDTLIYLYQTCWKTVQGGEQLEILPATREELLRTGWHIERVDNGDAVVMRASERTLCIAVAQMEPDRLADLLRSCAQPEGRRTLP